MSICLLPKIPCAVVPSAWQELDCHEAQLKQCDCKHVSERELGIAGSVVRGPKLRGCQRASLERWALAMVLGRLHCRRHVHHTIMGSFAVGHAAELGSSTRFWFAEPQHGPRHLVELGICLGAWKARIQHHTVSETLFSWT